MDETIVPRPERAEKMKAVEAMKTEDMKTVGKRKSRAMTRIRASRPHRRHGCRNSHE